MTNQDMADRSFLALDLYREARGEPKEARVAVAMVVLNRVAKPQWWGKDVMSVLFKKWQFSSLTDPKDPQLVVWPLSADPVWQDCMQIASDAIDGKLDNSVPGADSYYDVSMKVPPTWATPKNFVAQIGRLRFHNVDEDHET